MKSAIRLFVFPFLLTLFLICNQVLSFAQNSFSKGVNITGWFQTTGTKQIQFSRYSKKDFENIKSLGCDVIRLPIDMTAMTYGVPDYLIDPHLYFCLDSAVTWAEELQMHLILDNHTMDNGPTPATIGPMLQKIWMQIANHYKDRSRYIYYELRNEPHDISTVAWANIEKDLINSIRTIDTVHTIVVGASGWNTYSEMSKLPVFADTNLIYTFHFYDPFLFTHQGATWPTPSMGSLAGVPFPYDAAGMPACPADLKGTWIEGSLNISYKTDGTIAKVKQLIDQAVAFKTARKVQVYCGEFGVYDLNSDPADRAYWYELVRTYLEEKGISWTIWDYHGGFGVYEKGSNGLFNSDLNIPVINALGLTAPEQIPWVSSPDSTDFHIYTDFPAYQIIESSAAGTGIGDFYSMDNPGTGIYCVKYATAPQYSNINFNFTPDRDLSYLKANKYFLEFQVRGDVAATKFDVRFIDSKTGTIDPKTGKEDHPWRIRRSITKAIAPMDGQWHYVKLPLSSFVEHGSWDNGWFNPEGAFDWTAVDRLEFVAEDAPLTGTLCFDQISITDTTITTSVPEVSSESTSSNFKIYPNPVNSTSVIAYNLQAASQVDISIYTLTGQKVYSIVKQYQSVGNYSIPINAGDLISLGLSKGIYICRLTTNHFSNTLKMYIQN
jgi:endoglucanase